MSLFIELPSGRPRNVGVVTATLFAALLSTACAAPDAEPIVDAEIAATAAARSPTPELVAAALEIADARALPDVRPEDALAPPTDGAFWRASALVYSPKARAARRAFEAASARASTAGAPGPLMFDASQESFADSDRERMAAATFDVLGLFGVGRSAAARALATAEARAAYARYEQAVFDAWADVARARVDLAAVRAKVAAVSALLSEADADAGAVDRRAAILKREGRLSDADVGADARVRADLAATLAMLRADEAEALSALGRAAGLPPEHPATNAVDASLLTFAPPATSAERDADVEAVALLERLPSLRALKLEYAAAEARLRAAAAENVPEIRLGPRAMFAADEFLKGGVLGLSIPWPGSTEGPIQAAVIERTSAREALVEALLDSRRALRAARERRTAAIEARRATESVEAASREPWTAARARFELMSEPGAFSMRAEKLAGRLDAVVKSVDAARADVLAAIERDVAEGVAP